MWGRRIVYLVSLLGGLVFYGLYKEWLSWILLVIIFVLPWFSLALSLPAMLTVQVSLRCPQSVRMGVPARTALRIEGKLPAPPVSSKIKLKNNLTGAVYVGEPGELIPTEHSGVMVISYDQVYIYDYLGLFRRRLRRGDKTQVYIEPKPVPSERLPELAGRTVSLWRPKPGGGFSENHDLRLYRPGDDLRNLHWKMSAKTGKLIYREPIEPVQKGYLITMSLAGTPDVLDKKLGQLLWLSNALLDRQLVHSVRCHTGNGQVHFPVADKAALELGMHKLLEALPVQEEREPEHIDVLWKHHIGGGGDAS